MGLYGHDINHLTREELMKVVITQNTKIIDDRSDIDQYHKNVTDLKEKMQAQERDKQREIETIKQDCAKKETAIKGLKNQIAALGRDVQKNNAVVTKLNNANIKLASLTKTLNEKEALLSKQKNDLNAQITARVAENTKLNTLLGR